MLANILSPQVKVCQVVICTGKMSVNSLQTYYQATGETSGTVNSYLVFHSTYGSDSGTVTFDGEIIGIFWDVSYIHSSTSGVSSSSNASTVRSYI